MNRVSTVARWIGCSLAVFAFEGGWRAPVSCADDEILADDTPEAMGDRQPHLVDLGSNFDTNLFERGGNSWVIRGGGGIVRLQVNGGILVQGNEARQPESPALTRARAAGKKRLERIESACDLSADQRRRIELAVESDAHRFAAEIDDVRSRYLGRQINLNGQAGQKEWHNFQQDVQRCRERLRRLFDEGSLFTSVLRTTLDERQLATLVDEQASRRAYHWRTLVVETLARLDDTLALSEDQHETIEALLADRVPPLRTDGDMAALNDSNLRRQIVLMVLSDVDTKKLRASVSERQWKTLGNLMSQGRAMRSWIEAQGVLEPGAK